MLTTIKAMAALPLLLLARATGKPVFLRWALALICAAWPSLGHRIIHDVDECVDTDGVEFFHDAVVPEGWQGREAA